MVWACMRPTAAGTDGGIVSVAYRIWSLTALLAVVGVATWLYDSERQRGTRMEPLWRDSSPSSDGLTGKVESEAFQDLPIVIDIDEGNDRVVLSWSGRPAAIASVGQRSPDGSLQVIDIQSQLIVLQRIKPRRGQLRVHRQDLQIPAEWISLDMPVQSIDRLVLLPFQGIEAGDGQPGAAVAGAIVPGDGTTGRKQPSRDTAGLGMTDSGTSTE